RGSASTFVDHSSKASSKEVVVLPINSKVFSATKKMGSVLYISQDLPDYDNSSGGKRATRMLTLLAQHLSVYVFTLGDKPTKYQQELSKRGIVVLSTTNYKSVKKQVPHLTAIVYSTYRIYHESNQFVKLYPTAKVIIDSVDVNWLREERSIGIWQGLTAERVAKNKAKEIAAYQAADTVWTVTEADKKVVLVELPDSEISVVSNVHEPVVKTYRDSGQHTLLFIGNYTHYPNISAVQTLASTIFPAVKAVVPEAQLVIAGSQAPPEVIALANRKDIIYRGFVAEEEMEELYRQTFLSVSPLLVGAGIKGKICEAIAYRTPVVTNSIGNEGINLAHEREGLIGTIEEMPKVIIAALQRAYDFDTMTEKAQKKLANLVGPEVVRQSMLTSIFREVSICIVTWNKLELLKRCITSILDNTNYPHYKILVHSNACTDGTQAYLKQLAATDQRIIPFLGTENEVFVRPNNKMMRAYPNTDIVLLNNDVEVTENWLSSLQKAAYTSEEYGIAGAKILYPDGVLQEFGAAIYADGTGVNIGKGDNQNKKRYNKLKQVGYVSGCAMYIKRSTIASIGVFDDQFHPCYFEDSDYCYTAKTVGLQTVVTPESVVYHHEGATAGTTTDGEFKQYQAINRARFLAKHKHQLN
ncbi:MAG: glycosyltransferase, partial [Bacteroidota bacterium]